MLYKEGTKGFSIDGISYYTTSAKSDRNKTRFNAKVTNADIKVNIPNSPNTPEFVKITPSDGIPELVIYLVMKDPDNYDFETVVICDNDFKKLYPQAWIHWGPSYAKNTAFDYSTEIKKGIYRETVANIPDENEKSNLFWGMMFRGVLISDMTPEEIATKKTDGMSVLFK